jgi:protein O-mannosyl-transferase
MKGNASRDFRVLFFGTGVLLVLAFLTYRQAGMYRDAETLWRTTIARNPTSGMAYNNLGLLLYQRGDVTRATYYLQRAVKETPRNAQAHNNLGNALRANGFIDDSITQFKAATEIRPDFAVFFANLGSALAQAGREAEAIAQYELAMSKAPDDPYIANNLASLLTFAEGDLRDPARAIKLAEEAVRLSGGNDPSILFTLSTAFAEAGRLDQSVATAEKGRKIALSVGNAALASRFSRILSGAVK